MSEDVGLMSGESGSNTGLPRSDRPNGFHPAVPGNGNGSAVQEHAVNGHASPTRPRDTAHAGNGATGGNGAWAEKVPNGKAGINAPPLFDDNADDFLCGTAISVYQNSGGPDSNWGAFENQRRWFSSRISNGDKCGVSNKFWDLYDADIERAAALNCKVFRLSIEWARIEPRQGEIDLAAIRRYNEIFDSCDRHGLKIMITLYHFVHPAWFDALGHFEKAENLRHYVNYAVTVFRYFSGRAQLWATFNEGNVQAFCGYVYSSFPPGRIGRFTEDGRYLMHIFQAHTAAYDALKAMPGGAKAQIGYVHNWMQYEAKYPVSFSAAWVLPAVRIVNAAWANAITLRFLQTGTYDWPKLGWGKPVTWQNPGGRPGCDFLGINYYGRAMLDWHYAPTSRTGEVMTDMPFPLYPPGMYQGIAEMSELGVPIWITETGCCDHTSLKRPAFFHSYLDEIVKAVEDGHDVRGITMWTLVDNFEWSYGWGKKFGLYGWDHGDPTFARKLHETSKVLADIYKTFPERIRVAREQWNQRAAAGDAAPRHVPVPDAQAAALLKKGSLGKAIKTHQIGLI